MPLGVAMPKAWVAWSTSPQMQPPATRAVCAAGSTRTPFIERQVDDQAVITGAQAGAVVPAAANGERQAVFAGDSDGGDDIAASTQRAIRAGSLVDHAVV